jgi:hypothetical protein
MLSITVSARDGQTLEVPAEARFDEAGGTIGRAGYNRLVLPDAGRRVALVQACVVGRRGVFVIRNVGHQNTIVVNGRPCAPGAEAGLAQGDTVVVGGYTLRVSIAAVAASADELLHSLLEGAGVPGLVVPGGLTRELMAALGQMLRTVAQGTLDLMQARGAPKSESRAPAAPAPGPLDDWFAGILPAAPAASTGPPVPRADDDPFAALFPIPGEPHASADPLHDFLDDDPLRAFLGDGRPADSVAAFSEPAREDVKLGAAAPAAASPGQQFVAHFVAYPAGQEAQARRLIESQSPDVMPVLGRRSCRWARGTEVRVALRGDHVQVEPAEQPFEWLGEVQALDFSVKVAHAAPPGDVVLRFDVSIAGFLVAALCLTLRIGITARPAVLASTTASAARTAFASYASPDRALVTHMVGAIERSAGIAVYQDCLDLKPGEAWKEGLNREILSRDLFLLFWSRSAAESKWVEWEWKTALRDKGTPAMQVHPLQPGVEPPDALRHLHWSSVHTIVADHFSGQRSS